MNYRRIKAQNKCRILKELSLYQVAPYFWKIQIWGIQTREVIKSRPPPVNRGKDDKDGSTTEINATRTLTKIINLKTLCHQFPFAIVNLKTTLPCCQRPRTWFRLSSWEIKGICSQNISRENQFGQTDLSFCWHMSNMWCLGCTFTRRPG